MKLQRLPLDVIRPILFLLDLTSLARLNATFNISLQRSLSSAGIIPLLELTRDTSRSAGPIRYLLKTLRNVGCLTFETGAEWSLRTLSTLLTLNPITVTLNAQSLNPSVIIPKKISKKGKSKDSEPVNLENLSPDLLPPFALLTPRLTTLHIMCDIFSVYYTKNKRASLPEFLFPPTLTSFCLRNCSAGSSSAELIKQKPDDCLLQSLPSTLRSLKLRFIEFRFIPLNTIFSRFTTLEILELSGTFRVQEPTPERLSLLGEVFAPVPVSLRAFHLSHAYFWFEDLLRWWRFSESNVSVVEFSHRYDDYAYDVYEDYLESFDHKKSEKCDANLSALLPPTVEHLILSRGSFHDAPPFVSLPSQSLTSLTVKLQDKQDEKLWLSVLALPQLRSLVLHGLSVIQIYTWSSPVLKKCCLAMIPETDENTPWSINPGEHSSNWIINLDPRFLPRTLTHLGLPALGEPLTEASISFLPSGLKTLLVDELAISLLPHLLKCLPSCALQVRRPIDLWKGHRIGLASMKKFPEIWAPVFDFHRWCTVVTEQISIPNADLELIIANLEHEKFRKSPKTETLIWTDSSVPPGTVRFSPSQVFDLGVILSALPNLTKIVITIPSPREPILLQDLPPTLTHLELGDTPISKSSNFRFPSKLRHLSSNQTFNVDEAPPSSLTHLDASKWHFPKKKSIFSRKSKKKRS